MLDIKNLLLWDFRRILGNWVVARNYGVNYGFLKFDLFSSPWDGVLQICSLSKFLMHGLWDPIGEVSIAMNIRFNRFTKK